MIKLSNMSILNFKLKAPVCQKGQKGFLLMGPLLAIAGCSCFMLACAYWQLYDLQVQKRARDRMTTLIALESFLGKLQGGSAPVRSGVYQEQDSRIELLVTPDGAIKQFYWVQLTVPIGDEALMLRSGVWRA